MVAMLTALLIAAAAAAVAAEPPAEKVVTEKELVEDDYVLRLSLPTEDDREAWGQPGFGVSLGLSSLAFAGEGPAPRYDGIAFAVRPRIRVDDNWTVALTLSFAGTGGALWSAGLRWSASAEITFHPMKQLGLTFGGGYAGFLGDLIPPDGPPIQFDAELASRTISRTEKLPSCQGGGLGVLTRADYLIVVGPLFATGPFAQLNVQTTRCELATGQNDRETGQPILLTQWWRHAGAELGWWVSWR